MMTKQTMNAALPDNDLTLDDKEDGNGKSKLEQMLDNIIARKLSVGKKKDSYKFASAIEQDDEYVSYFLIKGDVVNGRDWGVTNESIPQHIHTFKGMPFVITSDDFIENSLYNEIYDHPNVRDARRAGLLGPGQPLDPNDIELVKSFQSLFRVGIIEDVIKVDDSWRAVVKKDEKFKGRQFPPFCSPAIFRGNDTDPDDAISEWEGIHLAGLDERPAYGNIALYKGACSGTLESCKTQFRHASAPKPQKIATVYGKGQSTEPCKIMQLRKALAVHNIKMAALLSTTNSQTKVQNLHCRTDKKDGKCVREFSLSEKDAKQIAGILHAKDPIKFATLRAFTRSSSFVGNVRHDSDENTLRMILNGKAYVFCGVSEREYDVLEGSTSVGSAFNNLIKNKKDC